MSEENGITYREAAQIGQAVALLGSGLERQRDAQEELARRVLEKMAAYEAQYLQHQETRADGKQLQRDFTEYCAESNARAARLEMEVSNLNTRLKIWSSVVGFFASILGAIAANMFHK